MAATFDRGGFVSSAFEVNAATTTASGTLQGVGTAAATGRATATSSATAQGVGTTTATGASTATASGTLQGTGTASATGAATAAASGTLQGAGGATGTGAAAAQASSTLQGAGTAAATGTATAQSSATVQAAGTASAVGVASAEGLGTASGVGTALAQSASVAEADGSAPGAGTATGVSFVKIAIISTGGGGNTWRDEPVRVRTGGRSGAKVTTSVTDEELRGLYERIMGLRPAEADEAPVPAASKKVQAKVRKAIKDYAVTTELAAGIVPTQYIDWASVAQDMQTVDVLLQAAQRAIWDEEDAVMALLLAS